jgi:hypothetical protein
LEEVISGFTIRQNRIQLTGISVRVSAGETILQKTITEWQHQDRYTERNDIGVMARVQWRYESAESEIDSGRMTVVKAVTSDLASVEEVTVDG